MAELSSAWETFFSELASFLMTCQRHYGSANERFTEYAIDHLSTCCQSVSTLHNRITTVHSIDALGHNIARLLDDLQQILQLWRDYFDSLSTGMCYQAPTEVTSAPCRGHPRFNISADQLQYLRSHGVQLLTCSWLAV